MAGGTPTHAFIAATVIRVLGARLLGTCKVFSSDLRIRVEATDLATFPDVSVVCGEVRVAAGDRNAIVNPTLLVEVTSPSTEAYDRGEKQTHYKRLPGLAAVLICSHRRAEVTVITKGPSGWTERVLGPGEMVTLAAPPLQVDVADLYQDATLDDAPPR